MLRASPPPGQPQWVLERLFPGSAVGWPQGRMALGHPGSLTTTCVWVIPDQIHRFCEAMAMAEVVLRGAPRLAWVLGEQPSSYYHCCCCCSPPFAVLGRASRRSLPWEQHWPSVSARQQCRHPQELLGAQILRPPPELLLEQAPRVIPVFGEVGGTPF